MKPRRCAWLTLAGALVLSVAAQLAHACAVAGPGGPAVGALIASTAWPVLTLAAVEIATRTPWPAAFGWQVLRWLGAGGVATVAAAASYTHMSGLLALYGEGLIVATLGPLAVDGLMLSAAAALLACDRAANAPAAVADDPDVGPSVAPDATADVEPSAADDPETAAPTDVPAPLPAPVEVGEPLLAEVLSLPAPLPSPEPEPEREPRHQVVEAAGLSGVAAERATQVVAAIQAGEIDPQPTAEAILRRFGGASAAARQIRDAVANVAPPQMPGQSTIFDHTTPPAATKTVAAQTT